MKIMLRPTGHRETAAGRQFRVFEGIALEVKPGQIPLQMLGMFRIGNPEQRALFAAALPPEMGDSVPALDTARLITGVDERPTLADVMREHLHRQIADIRAKPLTDDVEAAIRGTMVDTIEMVLRLIETLRGVTR